MVNGRRAPVKLESVGVAFDDGRSVSDAGLLLPATLAGRLGIERLVDDAVDLGEGVPGAALAGRMVLSLVQGLLAGAGCIDEMEVVRAGRTGLVLGQGCWRRRRWGRSCARAASGMCASSSGCS